MFLRTAFSKVRAGSIRRGIVANRLCAERSPFLPERHYHASKRVSARVTDVDLYSDVDRPKLVIEGYSSNGFEVNGVTHLGAQLIFSDLLTMWDVETVEDITVESLSFVLYASPKIDMLLIGTPSSECTLDPALVSHFKECGVIIDHMRTTNACQTFNVLNQEDRRVAAALLPMELTERDECIVSTFD